MRIATILRYLSDTVTKSPVTLKSDRRASLMAVICVSLDANAPRGIMASSSSL
ncbi:hypothetical protein [Tiger frog virus]|uniref:Uncharacterized protein n=1 Tax=Rana tigrina ranavirus TaxID=160691 RepID=Q2WER9_RTRV|nr:hypothetical protein [Tiger frog virus]